MVAYSGSRDLPQEKSVGEEPKVTKHATGLSFLSKLTITAAVFHIMHRKPRRFHADSAICGLFLRCVGRHQRGEIQLLPVACGERTCHTKTPAFQARIITRGSPTRMPRYAFLSLPSSVCRVRTLTQDKGAITFRVARAWISTNSAMVLGRPRIFHKAV